MKSPAAGSIPFDVHQIDRVRTADREALRMYGESHCPSLLDGHSTRPQG